MSNSTAQPRSILFLDDDKALLEVLGQLFARSTKETWQVHLADSTAKALQILGQHSINLAILDIKMPVVDGVQFMQLLNRKHPGMIKVVMTGYATEEHRAAALKAGAELFLEKPRTPEGFETVFATLNELVTYQPQDGFRGVLRKVGLQDVLQMECLGRNSVILEISTPTASGRIYVRTGNIIHAEMGTLAGEPALNSLLLLAGGEFNLKPFLPPKKQTIEGQWEFLLMEAARLRDETVERRASEAAADLARETNAAPASGPAPVANGAGESRETKPEREAAPSLPPAQIDEIVVCSSTGDVLYEWRCPALEPRLKLIDLISRRSAEFGQMFPLGTFDRLEIQGPRGRILARIRPGEKFFVRSSLLVSS